ncbi:zinc knuckle CX2CX4HX4C [Artemisia annua]|uniref:Zinc knuckle CX2CX4HX4C n=1 Tax=Artemisia annua TaxID=35608 RepID=A0A2U1KIJ1_ARTAN|nr:zinc knuckle CX2CX4HX4C [Artemisia annua]
MPVPFDNNPILNPSGTKNVIKESKSASNVCNGGNGTNISDSGGENVSGNKDVEMKEPSKSSKPLLFSNVVQGAKIPLWVRIYNVPLEAWNMEGISRIASRIGTPLIMDKVTTTMCEKGYSRASYARVLVEVVAAKGTVHSVEIWYRKLNRSMCLKVEYAWQPLLCSHRCVFGHSLEKCTNRVVTEKEKAVKSDSNV